MSTKYFNKSIVPLLMIVFGLNSFSQTTNNDIAKIDYEKIYAYCLDGNVTPALHILEGYDSKKLSVKDLDYKTKLENRFRYDNDKSDSLESRKSSVSELLKIFTAYWRLSLLDNSKSYDSLLARNLSAFLDSVYQLHSVKGYILNDDTIDSRLKQYITSAGYHTTGFGRTGKYLDLLIWKSDTDTNYQFSIYDEKINTRVIFMDDFITLGWEEYATMGRCYPGGWATSEALYCVRNAYVLNSEDFLISYLCHEGRHFSDYKIFPKLSGADLEYRAKLTELSLLRDDLFQTINDFISNANYESDNAHSVADFCVIRDLSKDLFNVDFEKDLSKWKSISKKKINKEAYKLLQANTGDLQKQGMDVEKYIKK